MKTFWNNPMKTFWNNPAKRRECIEFSVGVLGGALLLALAILAMVAL